ncbi:MAG TPA: hypothetical protein VF062_03605 [Candidatus Limnocylindrales bacterium]
MLQAPGLPAVFSHHALSDSEMTRYHAVIDSLLDRHEPLPAAVIDRYGALVRTNAAFERLTPGLVGVEPEDLVDRLLGPGPWRDTLVNWPEVAAAWLARHRQEADRTGDPPDPASADLAGTTLLFGLLPTYWPAKAFWLAADSTPYWPYIIGGLTYNGLLAYLMLRRLTKTAR